MLSGLRSRRISQDYPGNGLERSAETCTHAAQCNLRCDLEDIFDQEVIGNAGFQRSPRLAARAIQLIHRLQSTQDVNVRHAVPFAVFTRFYVSPGKNGDDAITFLWIRICRIGQAPRESVLTVLIESENQQTVVLLRPVVVAVDMLPQPLVASHNAGWNRTIVHVVYKVRDYKRNSG